MYFMIKNKKSGTEFSAPDIQNEYYLKSYIGKFLSVSS